MNKQASIAFLALFLLTSTTTSANDANWILSPSITASFPTHAKSKYLVLPYGDVNLTFGDVGQVSFVTSVIGHPTQPFPRQDLARLATEYFQNSTGRQMSSLKSQPRVATINARCPSGIELRIADELCAEYHWVTIVEDKLYIVSVKAASVQTLKSPAVKAFLASIEIKKSAGEER